MAVRSKRLFGPTEIGPVSEVVYSVTSYETALLKTLRVVSSGPLPLIVTLGLNGPGLANAIDLLAVPSDGVIRLDGMFIVLQPFDDLVATTSGPTAYISGFGAELEGFAD